MDEPMGKPAGPRLGKLTPFMIFYLENRDRVKNHVVSPINSQHDQQHRPEHISKEIARLWRSLDSQRLKEYCMLSNLYAECVEKYGSVNSVSSSTNTSSTSANSGVDGNRGGIGNTRQKIDPRLAKPPISNNMFSRHHRATLGNENPELSSCEWLVRTQGSKKREDDELSAASTAEAPVTSTTGATSTTAETASTATVAEATTAPTAAASIATTTVGQASNPIALGQTAEEAVATSDSTPSSVTGIFGSLPLPMDTSPAEESLPTLPQKRNVAETASIEASWSAAPLTPSSQHQESSSQTTAKHAPCAKRQRVEEIPSSAPGLVGNMASNVATSPETLPLTTFERGEARVSPKAMPTRGTVSPLTPPSNNRSADRTDNRPEHVGVVASGS